ncbi:MAG: hypothetical protein PVG63_03700 [Anaerolineales bacterium]
MAQRSRWLVVEFIGLGLIFLAIVGCSAAPLASPERTDGAWPLDIQLEGSLQNPAWSPDGEALVFTRFRDGYNHGPADLFIYEFDTGTVHPLVMDGSVNVNLPGSAWSSPSGMIVFSSDRGQHDEIFLIAADGSPGDEFQCTRRAQQMAYEPSFSSDGRQVVFESHPLDVEGQGVITLYSLDGGEGYHPLSPSTADCRQPNWSPADDIVYQCLGQGRWDLWVNGVQITTGEGDKTDASFSDDGSWIVYSSDQQELEYANLFFLSADGGRARRLTHYDGYDGAPSWSPTGGRIVFESSAGDPDESVGTSLWVLDLFKLLYARSKV